MTYDFFAADLTFENPDPYVRMLRELAAQYAANQYAGEHREHRDLFHGTADSALYNKTIQDNLLLLRNLGLLSVPAPLRGLPSCAMTLTMRFTLAKNFLSRDDAAFYPIDNPIRKDRVFRIPMIPGSAWKGALRSAAVENLIARPKSTAELKAWERLALITIFGDEKGGGEDEPPKDSATVWLDRHFRDFNDGTGNALKLFQANLERDPDTGKPTRRRAALHCLPTWFNGVELDVINPRSTTSRAGIQPILYEVVPAETAGTFAFLYLPLSLVQAPDVDIRAHHRWHFMLIAQAVRTMFLESGFGAKSSSGCGRAHDALASPGALLCSPLLDLAQAVPRISEIPGLSRLFAGEPA